MKSKCIGKLGTDSGKRRHHLYRLLLAAPPRPPWPNLGRTSTDLDAGHGHAGHANIKSSNRCVSERLGLVVACCSGGRRDGSHSGHGRDNPH